MCTTDGGILKDVSKAKRENLNKVKKDVSTGGDDSCGESSSIRLEIRFAEEGVREIRTSKRQLLICKTQEVNGEMLLLIRNGKKEDTITIQDFLRQIFHKPVTLVMG